MGGQPRFPFPKQVWSPSGGWWAGGASNPVHWKRNTAIAFIGLGLVCIPLSMWGFRHERRSPGHRPVYSSRFSGHLAEDNPDYWQRVNEYKKNRKSIIERIWPDQH